MKVSSYIFLSIYISLIIVVTSVTSRPKYPWFQIKYLHQPTCAASQCVTRAKEMLESLDQTVDPCSNFFEYACSGWQRKNPVPSSRNMWNLESKFTEKSLEKTREILEKSISAKDTGALKKAKKLYQACATLPNLEKVSAEEINKMIRAAGPWPLILPKEQAKKMEPFNWLDIHYYYFSRSSESGLFAVDISADPKDHFNPILDLVALHACHGLILPDGKWKEEQIKQYYLLLIRMIFKVVPDISHKVTERHLVEGLQEVFAFRRKLQSALDVEVFDIDAFHPIIIKDFQYWYDSKASEDNKINWVKTLNSLFSTSGVMTYNTRINVKHKKYFASLVTVLNDFSPTIISNHIHLYMMERYLDLDLELKTAVSNLLIYRGMTVGSVRELDIRWHHCISSNLMRQTIGETYVENNFSKEIQKDVFKMVGEITSIVKMQVNDSIWLDEESKARALRRIDDIKITIGYPDYYFTYKKPKLRGIYMYPESVTAFYSVNTNRIFISAAYFQPPLYGKSLPYVINYATTGVFIGHELYHMFDKMGLKYKIFPKQKPKTLWPEVMVNIYKKKAECIVRLFNQPIQELQYVAKGAMNDGRRTYNENFADLMALRAAYEAFKKRVLEEEQICPILPIKNSTCEKLFFVSYATAFCSNMPDWKILRYSQYNSHSVSELRVNIPLANMPEFSAAYQCDKKSYANSLKRCYLWD